MREGARRMDGHWGETCRGFGGEQAGGTTATPGTLPAHYPTYTQSKKDWEQGMVQGATYLEMTK